MNRIEEISEKEANIYIYGVIGISNYWTDETDNTISGFHKDFKECEKKYDKLNIHINSPGGYLYDGCPIYNLIKNSKKEVHTYNDGFAASMAAIIFMAGKKRFAAKNSTTLFHAPVNIVAGNASDFLKAAENLNNNAEALALSISEECNMTKDEIMQQFFNEDDHEFSAEKMLQMNFIDGYSDNKAELPEGITQKHIKNFQQNKAHILNKYEEFVERKFNLSFELNNYNESITEMNKENLIKILDMASDSTDEQIEDKVKDLVKNQIQQTSNNEEKPPITNSVGMTDEDRQKIIDGVAAILGKPAEKQEVQDTTAPPKENVLDMKSPMSYKEQLEAEYAKEEN